MLRAGSIALVVLAWCSAVVACRSIIGLTAPEPADGGADMSDASDAGDATAMDANAADTSVRDASVENAPVDSSGDVVAKDASSLVPYWTFADGFESGDLTHWQQVIDPGTSGSLTVVDAGAYEGCCAMRTTIQSGTSRTDPWEYALQGWLDSGTPAVNAGTIAVRAHMKVESLDQNVGVLSITQGGSSPVWWLTAVFTPTDGLGEGWGLQLLDPANSPNPGNSAGQPLPEGGVDDTWHCVELDLNIASSGQLSFYVDPASMAASPSIPSLGSSTLAGIGWDSVQLGLTYSTPGTVASTIDFDQVEIALYTDTMPVLHIGCP